MTFDIEQTARKFEEWCNGPESPHAGGVLGAMPPGPLFAAYADEHGLTVDQQRAVRRESELLEVGDEPAD